MGEKTFRKGLIYLPNQNNYLTMCSRLTDYFPLPRALVGTRLPSTALLLYALLLDRATLSRKNGYTDDLGRIFVIYPQLALAHDLGISQTMVKRHLNALEEAGLLRRDRQYRREACRLFPLVPADAMTETGKETGRETLCSRDRKNGFSHRESRVPPNNRKKQQENKQQYQPQEGSL